MVGIRNSTYVSAWCRAAFSSPKNQVYTWSVEEAEIVEENSSAIMASSQGSINLCWTKG